MAMPAWQGLLSQPTSFVHPWTGGRSIRRGSRTITLEGRLPHEFGFYRVRMSSGSRQAQIGTAPVEPPPDWELGRPLRTGMLVGDRLLEEGWVSAIEARRWAEALERATAVRDRNIHASLQAIYAMAPSVFLLEPGLDRFVRVTVSEQEDGRLIYVRRAFAQGPEADVLTAFEDRRPTLEGISGVSPVLEVAFALEGWQRAQVELRRLQLEDEAREAAVAAARAAAAQAEALARESQRQAVAAAGGTGVGRRELAAVDFESAARVALRLSGAELLSARPGMTSQVQIVRFRHAGQRFECEVDAVTLRVIDSGICLLGNDRLFTLESLPAVITEAIESDQLHIFRHG